jgi:hypothetical protein
MLPTICCPAYLPGLYLCIVIAMIPLNRDTQPHRAADRFPIRLFGAILLGMVLVYAILLWFFPLPNLITTARLNIGTATDRSISGAALLALAGLILYSLYTYGAVLVWRFPTMPYLSQLLWIGACSMSLMLAWAYPVTSTDVFDYIFRAHMSINYGANPYLDLPNQFKDDPFFRYVGWPNAPSAYGPLWELTSQALVSIGGSSLLSNVILFKIAAISSFLLCGFVISRLVQSSQLRLVSLYVWLWSPLALWEFAAVGHNDGLMILSLLLALWAVRSNRHWLGVLALTAGTLVKFLPAIFLPLLMLHWMRAQSSWPARVRVSILTFALFVLPTAVVYAPFWDVPPTFERLTSADQLTVIWAGRATTLRNIMVREAFLNASPLAVLSYILRTPQVLQSINNMLASVGYPIVEGNDLRRTVNTFGTILLAAGILWQSWHVWYKNRALHIAFFGMLLWYIIAGSQWFQPWYVLWLLAIYALWPAQSGFVWLTLWAITAQLSYLLQYTFLPNWGIPGQSLGAQAIYLLLIYPLPLLAYLLQQRWGTDGHLPWASTAETAPQARF